MHEQALVSPDPNTQEAKEEITPCVKRAVAAVVANWLADHLHAAVLAAKVPSATSFLAPALAALLSGGEGNAYHMEAIIQILPWLESTLQTVTLLQDVRLPHLQPHLPCLVNLLYTCWLYSRTEADRHIAAVFDLLCKLSPEDLLPHVATAVDRVRTAGLDRLTFCTDAFVRAFDRPPIAALVVEKLLSMRSDRLPNISTLLKSMRSNNLRLHVPSLLKDVDGYLQDHHLGSSSVELLLRLLEAGGDNTCNTDLNIVVLFRTMIVHLRRLPTYKYPSFSQWQRTPVGTALRRDLGRVLQRLSGPTLVAQADAVYILLADPEFESDVFALKVWNKAQNSDFTLGRLRVIRRVLFPLSRAVAPTRRIRLMQVLARMPLATLLEEGQRDCRLILEGHMGLLKDVDQPHISLLDGLSLLPDEVLELTLAQIVEALDCKDEFVRLRVFDVLIRFPSQKLLLYRRIISVILRRRGGRDSGTLLEGLRLYLAGI